METKKLKIKKIKIPIYDAEINVCTGDYDEYCDYISERYDVSRTNVCCYANMAQTNNFGLVQWCWFEDNIKMPIIVHEFSHAIFGIMKDIGIDISDEEVFCYMIEYVLNEFLCNT